MIYEDNVTEIQQNVHVNSNSPRVQSSQLVRILDQASSPSQRQRSLEHEATMGWKG
jgi:hypothetical protein